MADSGKATTPPGEQRRPGGAKTRQSTGQDRDAEPPTGGLAAILDRLRDAAAAHDDEAAAEDPGRDQRSRDHSG